MPFESGGPHGAAARRPGVERAREAKPSFALSAGRTQKRAAALAGAARAQHETLGVPLEPMDMASRALRRKVEGCAEALRTD